MNCFEKLFGIKKPVEAPKPIETFAPIDLPPKRLWLDFAKSFVGRCEGKDDEWICSLFGHTNYGPVKSSTVPWCAAFVCSMLEMAGMKSTRSAAANSFIDYGVLAIPMAGAICVWKHKSGSLAGHYHVNILVEKLDGRNFKCLGGNQHDSVCYEIYNLDAYELAACRMPK